MDAYIFGSGGFSKEILQLALDLDINIKAFVGEIAGSIDSYEILNETNFNPRNKFNAYIGIGSPQVRKKIVENLFCKFGELIQFPNLIHPSAQIMGLKNNKLFNSIQLGYGSIITPNCVITSHIKIGNFCQFNLNTTIGHDTIIGDYFTTAPGVHISGNNKIGNNVYFGTNSCTKEKINVTDEVVVGAGATVVSDIKDSGVYVGTPAKKINK